MEIIRGLHNCTDRHKGCVVTIGNFDGVHLGHKKLLERLNEQGQKLGLPQTLIVFEPQPQEYFAVAMAPPRLTRFGEKLDILRQTTLERVLCLAFNNQLARLSAEAITERLLVDALGAKYVLIGDDFHFGRDRQGNFTLLQKLGKVYGFETEQLQTVAVNGNRISSTAVRVALREGKLRQAEQLLGHPYYITGPVVEGRKLGRTLGAPTANIRLRRRQSPLSGVFVVTAIGPDGLCQPGLANIGLRPTVQGKGLLLEVHLLDFKKNLYGSKLKVRFLKKIREEQTFANLGALRAQIKQDIQTTRSWLQQDEELKTLWRETF